MYCDAHLRRVTLRIAVFISALAALPKISMIAEKPKPTETQRTEVIPVAFGALPEGTPIRRHSIRSMIDPFM